MSRLGDLIWCKGRLFCGNRTLYVLWLAAVLVAAIALPITVFLEFGRGRYAIHLFQLYPHMLLFPPMLFWAGHADHLAAHVDADRGGILRVWSSGTRCA